MLEVENRYDVVIVGAGPAGLRCGKILAKKGLKVIILEKNKIIGDKVCAGGMAADYKKIGIPEKIIEKKFFKPKIFVNKKEFNTELNRPIVLFERKKLGDWMSNEVLKFGCKIITNCEVVEINNDWVKAQNKKIYFKYLVGADGGNSIVRKTLGLKSKKVDVALNYNIKKKYNEMSWHLIPRFFDCQYVWFFPHKNYTSVGVGTSINSKKTKNIKKLLDDFLSQMNIETKDLKVMGGIINYDYQGYNFGNKFLIGEAAGFVSGLTDEGIYSAIISGEEIAKLIINPKYELSKLKQIIKQKKKQEKLLLFFQHSGIFKSFLFNIGARLVQNKKWQSLLKKVFYFPIV